MGESEAARTQRELAALRARIDDDVEALAARLRADLDLASLARRQPVAVFGTLGSLAVAGAAAVTARARGGRKGPDVDLERIVERLGGRVEKVKGGARKRLREAVRAELSEADRPRRTAREAAWGISLAALTAGATELARRFAGRLSGDESREP